MPIQNGKYVNPGWLDNGPPAIDDAELNAISDTLEKLDAGGGTGGGGGKRYARFVIGTSTNGWTAADCDYLCDGTADDVEIQAAINALPATGGEIVILDGTYNISDDISFPNNGDSFFVSLVGNGPSSILNFSGHEINPVANQGISMSWLYLSGINFTPVGDVPFFMQDCEVLDGNINCTLSSAKITNNKFRFSKSVSQYTVPIFILSFITNFGDVYYSTFSGNVIVVDEGITISTVVSLTGTTATGNVIVGNQNVSLGLDVTNGTASGNMIFSGSLSSSSSPLSGNYVSNGNISCVDSPCTGNTVLNGYIWASEGSSVTGNRVVQEEPTGSACISIGKGRNNNDENAFTVIANNTCEGGNVGILLRTNSYNNRAEAHAVVTGNACSSATPLQIEAVWSDCLITGNMFPNGAIVDNGTNNTKANNFTGT